MCACVIPCAQDRARGRQADEHETIVWPGAGFRQRLEAEGEGLPGEVERADAKVLAPGVFKVGIAPCPPRWSNTGPLTRKILLKKAGMRC